MLVRELEEGVVMAQTSVNVLDTAIQDMNELLKRAEEEFGWEGRREQTYSLLRVVLHGLRDRLPVNEAVNLGSQLPLVLKGVFYDGWDPDKVPMKYTKAEMVTRMQDEFNYSVEEAFHVVAARMLEVILEKVNGGMREKLAKVLPEDIAELLV